LNPASPGKDEGVVWLLDIKILNNLQYSWDNNIDEEKANMDNLLASVRATPKPASSMAHSTVTRALALWAYI